MQSKWFSLRAILYLSAHTHTLRQEAQKMREQKKIVNRHNGNESIARKIETLCQWLSSKKEQSEDVVSCRLHVDLFSLICIFSLVSVRRI